MHGGTAKIICKVVLINNNNNNNIAHQLMVCNIFNIFGRQTTHSCSTTHSIMLYKSCKADMKNVLVCAL